MITERLSNTTAIVCLLCLWLPSAWAARESLEAPAPPPPGCRSTLAEDGTGIPRGPASATLLEIGDPNTVASAQSILRGQGFDPGNTDGRMTPATRRAIRAFQRDRGLRADSCLSVALLDHLRKLSDLVLAVGDGDSKGVHKLLTAGISPEARDLEGRSAMAIAAYNGRTLIMDLLYQAGADPNAEGLDGNTPLMAAVRGSQANAAQWLIDHGASPEARTASGQTAVQLATRSGDPALLRVLRAPPRASPSAPLPTPPVTASKGCGWPGAWDILTDPGARLFADLLYEDHLLKRDLIRNTDDRDGLRRGINTKLAYLRRFGYDGEYNANLLRGWIELDRCLLESKAAD